MLRCSGCAGLVSEFAARCPACGRGVDDALELPGPPASHEIPGAVVQAAACEEVVGAGPPGSGPNGRKVRAVRWRARRAARFGLALGIAAGIAVWASLPTAGTPVPAALRSLAGRVIAQAPAGALSVDPGRGRADSYPLVPGRGRFTPVASSPDGRALVGADGTVVSIAGARAATISSVLADFLSGDESPARPTPFAYHDAAVVLVQRPPLGTPSATLVDLFDGHAFYLGPADAAGGDPQSLGAFVSVPSAHSEARATRPRGSDGAVELVGPATPPEVLATAAQLDEDVGWLPTTAVKLDVYPSPTGDAIAVVLDPVNPFDGDVPMVVLDRHGGVLAAVADRDGPMYGRGPVWSPGGHQFAYPTYGTRGASLAAGTETGTVETLPAPSPDTVFGGCVWSPASTDVVCEGHTGRHHEWLYATPTSKRLIPGESWGEPLAWVGGPL